MITYPASPNLHQLPNNRPTNYGPDICPEYSLAGRVRGTCRRHAILNAYHNGTIDRLPQRYYAETLDPEEIDALANGDRPRNVSGEHLPALEPDEVEIARIICWAIKKAPVVALYARPLPHDGGYALRFVNEFNREIVDYPSTIPRTLYLGELVALLNQARLDAKTPPGLVWYLAIGCVHHGWPAAELIQGVYPVSAYYPDLKLAYRAAYDIWNQRNGTAPPKTVTTNTSQL